MKKPVTVSSVLGTLDEDLFLRAAEALEECAHTKAGMSMQPDLVIEEDTQDWKDAQLIRAAVAQGLLP